MTNRIRDIRKAKGLTLADLAAACDPPTTAQTIGRLETGMRRLSLGWMNKIAAAMGVEPASLMRDGAAAPAQIVADAIYAAATDEPAKLRHPIGADAELIVATKGSMSFEEFDVTMRTVLNWHE
eukprot:gene21883-42057_t